MPATPSDHQDPARRLRRRQRERRSILSLAAIITAGVGGQGWMAATASLTLEDSLTTMAQGWSARLVVDAPVSGRSTHDPGAGLEPLVVSTAAPLLIRPHEATVAQIATLRRWGDAAGATDAAVEAPVEPEKPRPLEPALRMAQVDHDDGVLSALVARTAAGQDAGSAAWSRRSESLPAFAEARTFRSLRAVTAGHFLLSVPPMPLGCAIGSQVCQQPRGPPG